MDFLGLFFGLFPEKPIFTSEKNRFISGKHLIFEDLDLFYWAMEDVMERDDLCGGTAKTRDQPFCVLRKSKTGNFSVVTLQVATLKFPVLVFFAIHQKFSTGCFGTAALFYFCENIQFFRISCASKANTPPDSCCPANPRIRKVSFRARISTGIRTSRW